MEDIGEIIAEMDELHIDKKVLIAMPPDIEREFHYGEYIPEYNIRTLTSHEWISKSCSFISEPIRSMRLLKSYREEFNTGY